MTTIAAFLHVEDMARAATTPAALRASMVNNTRQFAPYTFAAVFEVKDETITVTAISDTDPVDLGSPVVQALLTTFRRTQFPVCGFPESVRSVIPPDLPQHILSMPLRRRNGDLMGALWLCRDEFWTDTERMMLNHLGNCYSHALAAFSLL